MTERLALEVMSTVMTLMNAGTSSLVYTVTSMPTVIAVKPNLYLKRYLRNRSVPLNKLETDALRSGDYLRSIGRERHR